MAYQTHKYPIKYIRRVHSEQRGHLRLRRSEIVCFSPTIGLPTTNERCRYRPREYDTESGPRDPITGGAAALLGILGDFAMGFADIPVEILRAITFPSSPQRTGSKT